MRSFRRLASATTAAVLAVVVTGVDASYAARPPVTLSGPSPLAHCPGLPGTTTNFTAEPHLAVNPLDRDNIVAAWQQDRSYGARGSVVSYSRDGGRSWQTVTVPGADTCTPGQLAVADPWLTFDGAGTVYLASLAGRANEEGEIVAGLIVNRSGDGGATWSAPSTVTNFDFFDDKPTITADPYRSGVVYATWDRTGDCDGDGPCASAVHFSRSLDGARMWSAPVRVAPSARRQHNARVVVLPGGELRLFYKETSPTVQPGPDGTPWDLKMVPSSDGGVDWGSAQTVTRLREYIPQHVDGREFYAKFTEAVTADQQGRLHVVSTENTSPASDRPSEVRLRTSLDGGATWGPPRTVAQPDGHAGLPSIAVNSHGRVAVTWYDFGDDRDGDASWTMAYRAAAGLVIAPNWPVRTLSHFDAAACGNFSVPGLPGPKIPWIGEYFGLDALDGARFGTAYAVCEPAASVGVADIVFTTF